MNTNFEQIKQFFIAHEQGYVCCKVEDTRDHLFSDYFRPTAFKDCFYLHFDAGWCQETDPARYYIDPYDSFTFGINFVDYGDHIEVTDGNRTWECGCEAFEGSCLLGTHFDLFAQTVADYGFLPVTITPFATELHKVTTPETFVQDAIRLVELMLLLNYMDAEPPHIKLNDYIEADIAALRKTWDIQ